MSIFKDIPLAPADAIFAISANYNNDTHPNKINLGVGAYRNNEGKPWVLPVVKKAEAMIINDGALDHEYLAIDGLKSFTMASAKLILGADSPAIAQNRISACQTISGTGAVRMGAELASRFFKGTAYISNPTWANHRNIFEDVGMVVKTYPYWNPDTRGLDFEKMLETFKNAPDKSLLLLHACAHNPTGVDPTMDQWKQIAQVIREKNHTTFFDCAYQGFASGNLDKDAAVVRYFVEQGFELLVAQSYAKNFGLYGERAGCLVVVTNTPDQAKCVSSQLCKIVRPMISNPPAFGARIVSLVLNNPELYKEWTVQLKSMADRIIEMRKALYDTLVELKTPGNWNHIIDQIGMFSFTGLTLAQVKVLTDKYHTYLTDNGRISMAGLNTSNVKRFAESVDWVVRNV